MAARRSKICACSLHHCWLCRLSCFCFACLALEEGYCPLGVFWCPSREFSTQQRNIEYLGTHVRTVSRRQSFVVRTVVSKYVGVVQSCRMKLSFEYLLLRRERRKKCIRRVTLLKEKMFIRVSQLKLKEVKGA